MAENSELRAVSELIFTDANYRCDEKQILTHSVFGVPLLSPCAVRFGFLSLLFFFVCTASLF